MVKIHISYLYKELFREAPWFTQSTILEKAKK
jgi:hypothetical protein